MLDGFLSPLKKKRRFEKLIFILINKKHKFVVAIEFFGRLEK